MFRKQQIACVFFGALFLFSVARAQEEEGLDAISASGLLTQATQSLSEEHYDAAIPYLEEYLKRMGDVEDARVLALMQEVRLKLGKIMVYLEDYPTAVAYIKQYTEHLPRYRPREAYRLLAVSLYELGEYEPCVCAVTNALSRPLPQGLKVEKKEVDFDELSKDERGGLSARQLKRLEAYAVEGGGDELAAEITGDVPDPEPDYSDEDLVLLNMTLAEAYAGLAEWQLSVEPYTFVVEHAAEADRQGYATMQLINALVSLGQFDEAKSFVLQLSQTDARYDIRVNMALMNTAAALFNEDEYDSALMLYRMVLPRKELVAYQTVKMNEIRLAEGMADVDLQIVTNATGRIETLFGNKFIDIIDQQASVAETTEPQIKPIALIKLEEAVGALVSLPPYEDEVLYRMGQLYASVGRPWEAATLLEEVARRDPAGDLGQRAFYEFLQALTDPLEEYDRVETLGMQFLETYDEGVGPRQVALALTGAYQKQARWEAVKDLFPIIGKFVPSDDKTDRKFECELYYMQAIADLILLNYKEAERAFADVLENFPDSHQEDNLRYWHAMSLLFLQDYSAAFNEFEDYSVNFPQGFWVAEASFRGGICLFGMEKNEKAEERFSFVIRNYPNSSIYADARSMRGDLLAAKGKLNEAQADYEEAIKTARTPRQGGYATFQMVTMFEMESRYEEILTAVNNYLDRYGEEADVAKAAYWIGKTKLAQGLTGEAVAAYREAIIEYGGNIRQDGVDLIINELVNVSRRQLEDEEVAELKASLLAAQNAAENETLKLRLRVLMAKLDETELELGKELIAELDDLTQAPPPVLGVICDASFEAGDYSRAEEILELFQNKFEDSDFMRSAYKLRGTDLFIANDLDGAMKIVKDAQALYGTDPDAVWAQLMKGRIELQQGLHETSLETIRSILSVRAWRGAAYAEATMVLGEIEEAAGNLVRAFGWYQRVYFQYKGYANGTWAAEGYLASARCLQQMGRENDRRNTFRAMLFDKYVNTLPQADEARAVLGASEVLEIQQMIEAGTTTNITVTVEAGDLK